MSEIKSLTGLRGIAALYVVLYHFKAHYFFGDFLSPFFHHGYLAVDLFFILSGFVMALTYGSLFKNGITGASFKNFIGRRIARVYPLYIVMTLLFIIFYSFVPDKIPHDVEFSTTAIISNLFMVQAWGMAPSIVSAGWSISAEFAAYLVFPFLSMLVLGHRKYLVHFTAFISMIVIFILSQSSLGSIYQENNVNNLNIWQGNTFYPLIRCLAEFTIGLWAYQVYSNLSSGQNRMTSALQNKWASAILTAAILFCLAIPHTDALIVFLMPFFIISLASDNSPVAKFMGWAPLYLLGVVSYSLYLCHLMIFWIRPELINFLTKYDIPHLQFLAFGIQILSSLMLATFFYICIEKPGRIFFRKFLG